MPVYPVLKNAHSERFSSKGDCRPNFQNPGLFLASRVITCPSASRRKRCFLPQLSPFRNTIPDGAFRLNLGNMQGIERGLRSLSRFWELASCYFKGPTTHLLVPTKPFSDHGEDLRKQPLRILWSRLTDSANPGDTAEVR